MSSSLEQKRRLTAIRALEHALHPNTQDTEIVAGVYAWRRKIPPEELLEDVCRLVFDKDEEVATTLPEYREEWQKRFEDKNHRISTLMGENINLERQLKETKQALAEAKKAASVANAQAQVTMESAMRRAAKPKPAALAPTSKSQAANVYPVQYTTIEHVRFGDTVWTHLNWSQLRLRVICKLIDDGVPFEQIKKTIASISKGKHESYRYVEKYDISIKTRAAVEICREVKSTALALGIPVEITVRYPEKVNDKKDLYPEGLAFPGANVTVKWQPAAE